MPIIIEALTRFFLLLLLFKLSSAFSVAQLKEHLLLPHLLTVLALPLQTELDFLGGVQAEALSMASSYGRGAMPLTMGHLLHHRTKRGHLLKLEGEHQLAL